MTHALYDATEVSNVNLLQIAPVVNGAIVSKPLVDVEHLRQIVFAMDKGQKMTQHTSPRIAVVQVLDGQLQFGTSRQQCVMTAHDWLIMPPNEPHDVVALKPTRFLLTLVKDVER